MKIASTVGKSLSTWIKDLQEFQLDSIFETQILGRAYDYLPSIIIVSTRENTVLCQIAGTTLYDMKIEMVDDNINAYCNCPYDQECKHMAAMILSLMNIDWKSI